MERWEGLIPGWLDAFKPWLCRPINAPECELDRHLHAIAALAAFLMRPVVSGSDAPGKLEACGSWRRRLSHERRP